MIAYANIVFNDEFIVRGLRVLRKRDGSPMVVMPSRANKAGDMRDVAHPLTAECRGRIEAAVMAKIAQTQAAQGRVQSNA